MEDNNSNKKKKYNISKFTLGLILGITMTVIFNYGLGFINRSYGYIFKSEMEYTEKLEAIYDILDKNYVDDVVDSDLENMMYSGLVAGLYDPYSTYMNDESFKIFMESTSGTYYGIGAVVAPSDDNKILIVTPYENAPAYNAGIRPGDKIIEVNGKEVYGNALDEAVAIMKGPKGTSVEVTIEKKDKSIETVKIIRDEITIPTIDYKLMDNVGYIKISAFDRVTRDQFNEAYDDLLEQNIEGLLIDLRNNPGGLLDVVGDITGRLIPEGIVTYTEDKDGVREYIYSNEEEIDIPLVILVNGNSASASEVLSGAVKDTNKGILVGEQTFGKGLVQRIFPLSDGSAVKTTVARYYTPNGTSIHGEGITPDYIVEISDEDTANLSNLSIDEDIQLQKALEVIQDEIN